MKVEEKEKSVNETHQDNNTDAEKIHKNNTRITLMLSSQFLESFDSMITSFGYSRSSAILQAMVDFLAELSKKRRQIDSASKMRFGQR
jgi:metal-responsive CopG/Arc/MetJ family transcriptional regulator